MTTTWRNSGVGNCDGVEFEYRAVGDGKEKWSLQCLHIEGDSSATCLCLSDDKNSRTPNAQATINGYANGGVCQG